MWRNWSEVLHGRLIIIIDGTSKEEELANPTEGKLQLSLEIIIWIYVICYV